MKHASKISMVKTCAQKRKKYLLAIDRFEDIEAWQVARELTSAVYELSKTTPLRKDYGLRDQLQRASVSIMANVVHPVE